MFHVATVQQSMDARSLDNRSDVEAIQFLCVNKLPLRADGHSSIKTLDVDNKDEPSGLFLRLFEYTLSKGVKLKEIFNTIPTRLLWSKKRFSVFSRKSFRKTLCRM